MKLYMRNFALEKQEKNSINEDKNYYCDVVFDDSKYRILYVCFSYNHNKDSIPLHSQKQFQLQKIGTHSSFSNHRSIL